MDNYLPTSYNISSGSSFSSAPNSAKDKKKKPPTKKGNSNGVRLSTDPQSVAARERRHRISDRFKILQSLVPGGTKMDTVSMLEEAINYVKFLKTQIRLHQSIMTLVDEDASVNPLSCLPQDCEVPNCPDYYNYYPCLDTNIATADQQPAMSLPVPDHSCFLEGGGDQEAQPYYNTFMNNQHILSLQ